MKTYESATLAVLLAALTALSCQGGSDGAGALTPGPSGSFLATFTPDEPAPGNRTVALAAAPGGGGERVAVRVGVTGVQDVYGGSFRVTFDPSVFEFDDWLQGTLFENAGESALYQVSAQTPGVVEVGVACAGGCVGGIDVDATATLVQLVFRAVAGGNSALDFAAADLLDAQSPPGPIGGLDWWGGTLVAAE